MKGGIRKALEREYLNRGGAREKCRGFEMDRNRGNETRERMTRIKRRIRAMKKRKPKKK
jgi:hypothetical protein